MKIGDLNSISPYINFACVWGDNRDAAVGKRAKWIGDLTQNDVVIILDQNCSKGHVKAVDALTLSKHGVGWIDGRDLKDVK